jgi:hypothetical protein
VNTRTAAPKDIEAALRVYYAECEAAGTAPVTSTGKLYELLEARVKTGIGELSPVYQAGARTRFQIQMLYQLNKMARKGFLVKRGGKRDLRFYTPAAAAQEDREREQRLEQNLEEIDRHADILSRLRMLKLSPYGPRGKGLSTQLDADDWELLLDMAERGLRVPEPEKES